MLDANASKNEVLQNDRLAILVLKTDCRLPTSTVICP